MRPPAIPPCEKERLDALRKYGILDTPPESCFDGLVRLTAHLLDVPIALVTLVDADRQWSKSCHGLDLPEIARDLSFCGHVVAQAAPMVVCDARLDARFADNPLTLGKPHIRFYAGVPLATQDGLVIGTLCGIDTVPRELSDEKLVMLQLLA